MSDESLRMFLRCGIILCAAMAVINMLRFRSRGMSAWLLAGGFIVMAFVLLSVLLKWPLAVGIALGILVIVLLFADFVYRSANGKNSL